MLHRITRLVLQQPKPQILPRTSLRVQFRMASSGSQIPVGKPADPYKAKVTSLDKRGELMGEEFGYGSSTQGEIGRFVPYC